MARSLQLGLGWTLALLVVLAPWSYARYRQQAYRNFRVVHPGKLYRSGQMPLHAFQRTLKTYGIRTVINLRDGSSAQDQAEETFCRQAGVHFERLPHQPWWASDGSVPAQENVDRVCALAAQPENWPILIHCFAGQHRTGGMCAILRINQDGWTNEQAIAEMKALGFEAIDDTPDLLNYLRNYRPRSDVFRPVGQRGQP